MPRSRASEKDVAVAQIDEVLGQGSSTADVVVLDTTDVPCGAKWSSPTDNEAGADLTDCVGVPGNTLLLSWVVLQRSEPEHGRRISASISSSTASRNL
jgi:hypothetical protein